MGFWHTGYMEFHEPVGVGSFCFEPSPPRFPCKYCDEIYVSIDDLRKHRFERHPLRRPLLFLQGRELGSDPVRITQPLTAAEVTADGCDRAVLNGDAISVRALPRTLLKFSSEVCRLVLSRGEISSEFTLDFRIASERDLRGIEEQFDRTARGRRLDMRATEEFIYATSRFGAAIGYCDGICAYLYGILAKESAPDSSLPYEAYVGKFNKAAEELAAYDRPLARTIGSLIQFHFNHFAEASRLAPQTRVGQVAGRYSAWLRNSAPKIDQTGLREALKTLETLVTDWKTEQIIRWAVQPLDELSRQVADLESFLNGDITEFDKLKLHVLLAETYASSGDIGSALQHAKTLRNLSAFEKWAESMLRTHSKDDDEQC